MGAVYLEACEGTAALAKFTVLSTRMCQRCRQMCLDRSSFKQFALCLNKGREYEEAIRIFEHFNISSVFGHFFFFKH